MDKYKTNSAFNKWFSEINLENLSEPIQKKVQNFNKYRKKLYFEKMLQILLHSINDEKESLRDINISFVSEELQQEMGLESISHCQLSRTLNSLDSEILWAVFNQLVEKARHHTQPNKRNALYLIDSSTFPLNRKLFPWADFRQTKSGVKLHMKLCFMDKEHFYPEDFKVTPAKEHDDHHLECFVNQAEATYVFDRGYLNYQQLDQMHEKGYFFVTRLKKNSKVHVLEDFEVSKESSIKCDQLILLGAQGHLTHRYRRITVQDDSGKLLCFITNRFDCSAIEISEMYKSRWQVELFFKHIKQHMTIKNFFCRSEKGVTNQLILAMIASLLTYLVKLTTQTTKTIFQIKRLLKNLLFQPVEKWLKCLVPT